jgi:ATPase family associated with various cellular activities (AAA)
MSREIDDLMVKRLKYSGTNYGQALMTRTILKYNSVLDGYTRTWNTSVSELILGDKDDYFQYLAGKRDHLYPQFDPKKHIIDIAVRKPEALINDKIPFTVHVISNDMSDVIPDGLYKMTDSDQGFYLKRMKITSDNYIDFRKDIKQNIHNDIKQFKINRPKYELEGVRHKTATLLFGPPGTGKSREVSKILENANKEGFVCIFIGSDFPDFSILDNFKEALEGRDVVFVIEEITERTGDRFSMESLLSFLDGETSWNNCYVIATTNYPEMLPANIVDRPGRFNKLIEFGNPTKEERELFLQKRGVAGEDLSKSVELSEGLSLDYLTQSLTQSRITGKSLAEFLVEFKKTRDKVRNNFRNSKLGISHE